MCTQPHTLFAAWRLCGDVRDCAHTGIRAHSIKSPACRCSCKGSCQVVLLKRAPSSTWATKSSASTMFSCATWALVCTHGTLLRYSFSCGFDVCSSQGRAQRAVITACGFIVPRAHSHTSICAVRTPGDVITMLLGPENTMVELTLGGGTTVQLKRAAFFRAGACDEVSGVGLMLEESEKVMPSIMLLCVYSCINHNIDCMTCGGKSGTTPAGTLKRRSKSWAPSLEGSACLPQDDRAEIAADVIFHTCSSLPTSTLTAVQTTEYPNARSRFFLQPG